MKYREIEKSISKLWRLAFFIFILSFGVHSQIYAAEQDGKITLSFSDIPLREALSRVEKVSDYTFFYDEKNVNVDQKVRLDVKDVNMQSLMTALLKDTNLDFEISNRQIVLLPKKSSGSKTAKRHISGVVKDEKGETVIGASVVVEGTTTGTATDIDGRYALDVPVGAKLKITYVGYRPFSVEIKDQTTVDVTLEEDNKVLSEVVVTALGIKREKKMLGYSVQDIKADELNTTGDASVTSALQGKVAGLQMNTSSTGLGGSTKITIRGNSSLTDNNQPLWIVDGVPFTDNNASGASFYGGIDRGGTSIDINPDDIESISVLKGPNAAALYGSRAGNGVILVTTKKGTKKDGFGVSYNGTFTWSVVGETLDMQDKYGQGEGGVYKDSPFSYGAPLNGQMVTAWNGQEMPYTRYGNPLRDYFNTGFAQNHSVSVGNVTEKSNFRASFGYNGNDGLFKGETLDKITVDMKAGTELNKYLSMEGKVSVSRTKAENRPYYGLGGEVAQLLSIPNNIRLSDLQQYTTAEKMHVNWYGPTLEYLNPYYVRHQLQNSDERWRAFGYYNARINFTDWLHFSAKYAFDYYRTRLYDSDLGNGVGITSVTQQTNDGMSRGEENFFEQNAEFMLNGDNRIGSDFRIGYTLGANFMYQNYESLSVGVRNMLSKDQWIFNTGALLNTADNSGYERATNSVFGSLQLAFREYLSLDLTARNDWSSTLPVRNNSFFYPSANLSFVVSDFVNSLDGHQMPAWFNFAKVRVSAAQVGKDTDPYQLVNTVKYKYENGVRVLDQSGGKIKANDNLRPEISSSYEGGLEMKFFQNRLGFDFTYYYSRTKNQIMSIPAASPWTAQWINAGLITNKGFELMVYATPVQTKDFTFDINVNLSKNLSTVEELYEGKDYVFFDGDDNFPVWVGAVAGGKLGDIYARHLLKRNDKGELILKDGLPQDNNEADLNYILSHPIGNIQPDLLMSVTPTFSYKGFTLSAMFDMKFGGDIVSISEGMATNAGTAERTENRGSEDNGWKILLPGVKEDGTPNDIWCNAQSYYQKIGLNKTNGNAEEFVYDASYIKLKELSLGYNFSRKLLKKTPFTSLRLSFVGRNLGFLMKHAPGNPDGGYNTSMFSQAIDFTSVPYTRTFGFSVNIGF